MYWLRLVRWTNLVIVFITQLLVWLCVIRPAEPWWSSTPRILTPFHFLLLSLSTVFIAAAGYIINDYFDIRIDAINRPEKMVLEQQVPRRVGIILHNLLNGVALLMVLYLVRHGGSYWWLLWQAACIILLWFYSTHFKRRYMIGNVVVALLTALTIIVLVVYEPFLHPLLLRGAYSETSTNFLRLNPIYLIGVLTFFAFMLTWMREIVKDMEDFKGDEADGCRTMPIVLGLKKSGQFAQALGIIVLVALLFCAGNLLLTGNWLLGAYTLCGIMAPLVQWVFSINRAATTQHYARASRQLKIIMVLGIGSLLINYLVQWIRSY